MDGRIVVVGSAPILFANCAIDQPEAIVVLAVDDDGIVESQLVFTRGRGASTTAG